MQAKRYFNLIINCPDTVLLKIGKIIGTSRKKNGKCKKGLISSEICPFLALALLARLSAKLACVPFWLFNDSYQEKYT
jgi:hypothetical protein